MNRGLLWSLGATATVSAWLLFNPARPTGASSANVIDVAPAHAPTDRSNTPTPPTDVASTAAWPAMGTAAATAHASLPKHWPQPNVETADRNPFLAPQPPAPKPVAAVMTPLVAPPPPISNYRFWGRLAVAGSQRQTYVARGDDGIPTAIEVGTRLEDGWSVESIDSNAVVLVHAATQQRSTLSIPPHAVPGQPERL